MTRSLVRDLMTTPAICVPQDRPYKSLVELLDRYRISALPVVDGDGRLIGVVSESDLLYKVGMSDQSLSARLLEGPGRHRSRTLAAGMVARDLMSSPAVAVSPEDSPVTAAKRMHDRNVKHLPVVDHDRKVVGMLARSDLLQVFLHPDREIRDEVTRVLSRAFWLAPTDVEVEVRDGMVTLTGELELRSLIPVAVQLTRTVDGVVGVQEQLEYAKDDRIEDISG